MRDIKSISPGDWLVYLVVSLLLLAGVFVLGEPKMDADGWLLIVASSALLTFGIVIESQWQYRRSQKFWLILVALLCTHFVVLLRFHPKLSFLWLAPLSLLELFIIGLILPRFGFPLILKRRRPEVPMGPSPSLLTRGSLLIVGSTVLILLAWLFRFRISAGAFAGWVYVFFLSGLAGIGIMVVELGRWTAKRFREERFKRGVR